MISEQMRSKDEEEKKREDALELLEKPHDPSVKIRLDECDVDAPYLEKLVPLIEQAQLQELDLNLECNCLSIKCFKLLGEMFSSPRCPQALEVSFFATDIHTGERRERNHNHLSIDEMINAMVAELVKPLTKENKNLEKLYLDISRNGIEDDESLTALGGLIKSDSVPPQLTLELEENMINSEGAGCLASAIELGNQRLKKFILILEGNEKIGYKGAKAFANAFSLGKIKYELDLNLDCCGIPAKGLLTLVAAACSKEAPSKLTLNLSNNGLGTSDVPGLSEALNLSCNDIAEKQVQTSSNAIRSDKDPKELKLILRDCKINSEVAELLLKALQPVKYTRCLHIDLSSNSLADEGAIVMANAIKDGQFPPETHLNMARNKIGNKGAEAFTAALKSRNSPPGLTLNLNNNLITNEGVATLADMLGAGESKFGTNIKLSLYNNRPGYIYDFRELSLLNDTLKVSALISLALSKKEDLWIRKVFLNESLLLSIVIFLSGKLKYEHVKSKLQASIGKGSSKKNYQTDTMTGNAVSTDIPSAKRMRLY